MNYSVEWADAAEQQLAKVWSDAKDKPAVNDAVDEIDRRLGRDPHSQGESRSGHKRILFMGPLVVLFYIDEKKREVTVVSAGQAGKRP